jgi:hypothetical protein
LCVLNPLGAFSEFWSHNDKQESNLALVITIPAITLCPSLFLYIIDYMATRRRTSATKTAKTASATIKKSTPRASVKKVTTTAPKRVNKVTPTEAIKVAEVTPTPQIEKPEVKQETKSLPNFSQLRGIDFVIVPLIYLEAFVVNFLQNLDVKVPERVALK